MLLLKLLVLYRKLGEMPPIATIPTIADADFFSNSILVVSVTTS